MDLGRRLGSRRQKCWFPAMGSPATAFAAGGSRPHWSGLRQPPADFWRARSFQRYDWFEDCVEMLQCSGGPTHHLSVDQPVRVQDAGGGSEDPCARNFCHSNICMAFPWCLARMSCKPHGHGLKWVQERFPTCANMTLQMLEADKRLLTIGTDQTADSDLRHR